MSFVMLCEYCYENICCMSTNITSQCKLYHVGKKYFIKIRQMYIGFRVFIWTYCIVCVSAKYLPLFLQRSYVSQCSLNLCTGLRFRYNVSYYKLYGYCYTSTSTIIIITVDVVSCAPHCRVRRMARTAPWKGCAKTQKVM